MYKYFNLNEFMCRCGCGGNDIKPGFVEKLDRARDIGGIPFRINSGYRCPKHNAEVSKVELSAHVSGHGADIKYTSSEESYIILTALIRAGFTRVGVARTFIHVDDDPGKSANRLWLY